MEKDKKAAIQNDQRGRRAHRKLLEGGKHMLECRSLSHWEPFLKPCKMVPHNVSLSLVFTFEPLHNLHLGISKLLNECKIEYISSDSLRSNQDKPKSRRRLFFSMRTWSIASSSFDTCIDQKGVLSDCIARWLFEKGN